MTGYVTRVLTAEEIDTAVDWAAGEGWNPGFQDAACFAAQDADGFWGGFLDGDMVACISVMNYGDAFSFLGFYIVREDMRGRGFGYALWNAALAHAGDRVVGLDGVPQEQDNYRKSGFDLAWQNVRYGGEVTVLPRLPEAVEIMDVKAADNGINALDRTVFPVARSGFLNAWIGATGHITKAAKQGDDTVAFGTARPCREGWKIGGLTAQSPAAARAVLTALIGDIAATHSNPTVFLDVPETNRDAVSLARAFGLSPVFHTARMYRSAAPKVEVSKLYGVTSFELG